MNEPFIVPPADMMADLADDQLAALVHRLQTAIESCTETIGRKEQRGLNADGVRNARRHYERGLRAARDVIRARNGQHIAYEPARPVHNWLTAYHTLKAVNRLLGLAEQQHKAVTALLADDSDDNWAAVEQAHGELERALRDGGVEVEGVAA